MKSLESDHDLKEKIIEAIKKQGFYINPHIRPSEGSKEVYRQIHESARLEQLALHKKFLKRNLEVAQKYSLNGKAIDPNRISLEIREIKRNSLEEILFRWWNLVWWSLPYQCSYGRRMRFILWDTTHNVPFGLILLQSPVLKMSAREKYLEIPKKELDIWVNRSMHAQRVGALPPYNEILGGKMVALALTSNEIRWAYQKKYYFSQTLLKKRFIKPELLFITTTSAFGRSSIYNRLKYKNEPVAISLGFTKGSGTFHIPEKLYHEILEFLSRKGFDTSRNYGHGPSRKMKLISCAFRLLGLNNFEYHGIKRELYLFPLAKNLKEVIKNKEEPVFFDRPFGDLVTYWKKRWAIPRAQRKPEWKNFKSDDFFAKIEETLMSL